ncbi:hypothetical protein DNH61_14730 [Paenibacillus sambharensis]|uniref:Uncharacterized protein n=1 Tax=Paenibacillus sambharensis TaxID=1803190 RepID=A0A2W1LUG9_9BACL|nr:hypothetical protein [Paenibacillus sambharensis]PZD95137.1 hypothetical protein DNH61_14730 [Paenibacillus sambharensis]
MVRHSSREHEVKLELIASVAKSQHAMAVILQNIADLTDVSPQLARSIGENIRLLTGLQERMADSITGSFPGRRRKGKPAPPWISLPVGERPPGRRDRIGEHGEE